jgi:hypothetical protein
MKFIYLLICVQVALISCITSAEVLSAEELRDYIPDFDNGSLQENGYEAMVAYRRADLLVHQQIVEEVTQITMLGQLRKRYADHYYFILSISKVGTEGLHQVEGGHNDLVQTLSWRMHDDVTLTTSGQDTILAADIMLNWMPGLTAVTDSCLYFTRSNQRTEIGFNSM